MQNADNLRYYGLELIHCMYFSKPNSFIHYEFSIISFYAVFAVQNCFLRCVETIGQTYFRKIYIIHVWHIVPGGGGGGGGGGGYSDIFTNT